MSELAYRPTPHDREAVLEKAQKRKGFTKAYEDLDSEYSRQQGVRVLAGRLGGDDGALRSSNAPTIRPAALRACRSISRRHTGGAERAAPQRHSEARSARECSLEELG
jgi:hypothetical protein